MSFSTGNSVRAIDGDLSRYTNEYIETFLSNFGLLIETAEEQAAECQEMDEMELAGLRASVLSDWSHRHTLGVLYRAGRLTSVQVQRLRELDYSLLRVSPYIEIAYGPSLADLLDNLNRWGTPLTVKEIGKTAAGLGNGKTAQTLEEAR